MVTMIDEIFDRTYQAGRNELHAAVGTAFANVAKSIGDAFRVLNRIEYSAPWLERRRKARRA
jgi:hypothetical protein